MTDPLSIVALVIVALSGVGIVACCVLIWRSKGRMLEAAAAMRDTAAQWERLGRPDRAVECFTSARRMEGRAWPRKTAPTSTEGAAA